MKRWSMYVVILAMSLVVMACNASTVVEVEHYPSSWHHAKEMVKEAKLYINEHGRKAFIQALKNKQFYGSNIHMFAIDYRGKIIAHPLAKYRGMDAWGLSDPDRVHMVREMVKMAKMKGKGWIEYKFKHHETGQMMPKLVYIERVNNRFFIGAGIY